MGHDEYDDIRESNHFTSDQRDSTSQVRHDHTREKQILGSHLGILRHLGHINQVRGLLMNF